MKDVLNEIFNRHGQQVLLQQDNGEITLRTFLQPVAENREQPVGAMTAIGWADGRLWRYLGKHAVVPGQRLTWEGRSFRVRSSRPYAMGETVLYWWATLEQEAV